MGIGGELLTSIVRQSSMMPLRFLSEDDFTADELTWFRALKQHIRRYGKLPDEQTYRELVGRTLPRTPEPVAYYHRKVEDRKLYGQFRAKFEELKRSLQRQDMDGVLEIGRSIGSIRRAAQDGEETFSQEALYEHATTALRNSREMPTMAGVLTGWGGIDRDTFGYQGGDLIVWVARQGIGKTMLLIKQAMEAAEQGKSVLFVSMEMTANQIAYRMYSIATGINTKVMRSGQISDFAMNRINEFSMGAGAGYRFTLHTGGFTSNVGTVEALCRETTPDIIFVDGAYLLSPAAKVYSRSRFDVIAQVFKELKMLALSTDRPVVITTQMNRKAGSQGEEGSMETIAFSDDLNSHASLIYFVQKGPEGNEDDQRRIITLKGREGESGMIRVNYKFSPTDLSEVTREQSDEENNLGWA